MESINVPSLETQALQTVPNQVMFMTDAWCTPLRNQFQFYSKLTLQDMTRKTMPWDPPAVRELDHP